MRNGWFQFPDPQEDSCYSVGRSARILLGWVIMLQMGCAAAPLEVFPPVGGRPLAEDEGLLIIQIDTDIPLEAISFDRGPVAENLPKGRHLWMVRARAGHYSWNRIQMGVETGKRRSLDLDDYRYLMRVEDWVWDDEYEFDVVAAEINYPGELIIRSDVILRSVGAGYSVRNRNHSAMAIRELQKTHAATLRMYPLRYTGAGEDGFLDYYSRTRERLEAEGAGISP